MNDMSYRDLQKIYDTMSVHDLLLEAANDGMQGFLHDAFPELCELPEIEKAIRRAVIREAGVNEQIPAGKGCGECPFLGIDSEHESTCRLFEDPAIDNAHYDAHFDLLSDDNGDMRCPACLSAYPDGATVRIEAKEGK